MPKASSLIGPILVSMLFGGCSIEKLAIKSLSNVLAQGNSVFESDNDPEFVAEALPFSLKLIDALLTRQPDNRNLLLAGAAGYVFYSYADLARTAEELALEDIDAARALRGRATNLFLRAHDYAQRAVEIDHPDYGDVLASDPGRAVLEVGGDDRDVEMLYWNAVSLSAAISSSRNDPALLARGGEVAAQLQRALALNEAWNGGALHEFAINAAALTNEDDTAIEAHYQRALDLSLGRRASLFVSYAEATAVRRQDRQAFVDLLDRALSIDIDEYPELRLVNAVAQQRASWLLGHLDELFLE